MFVKFGTNFSRSTIPQPGIGCYPPKRSNSLFHLVKGGFFFWGNLIVKTESNFTQMFEHTEIMELKRVDSLDHFSIQQKINELLATQNGLNRSYANLPENQNMSKDSLMEGQSLPGFAFRSIDSGRSIPIDSICSKAAYTLIDIWASWCGPCIKSLSRTTKTQG